VPVVKYLFLLIAAKGLAMKTRIMELFDIQVPIQCGGMLWLAVPELAAAISNAGAMGNLTSGNALNSSRY
jgi:NAD(P)H-dependent flavin oxidoreductase YrpB (nitropropane dioxygenase family)